LEKSRKILVKFGENSAKFSKNYEILEKKKKQQKNSAIFNENFEIRDRCKGVHCVDLGESFPTHIYLQNLASIQPRTSPFKFARSPRTLLLQIPQVDPKQKLVPGLSVHFFFMNGGSRSRRTAQSC